VAKCLEILGPEIEREDTNQEANRLRNSFKYFFMKAWRHVEQRKLVMGWHIEMLCDYLQALECGYQMPDGRVMKDLLINIPPGFSKSVCVGVMWPAWVWTRNPQATFFGVSYSDKLSKRDSKQTRKIINSDWFQRYFDIQVTVDTAEYFALSTGGWRWSSTPGGFGTGEHYDHLIVDDPLNAKKAESKAEREFVNEDWWDLTMSTRGAGLGRKTVGVMQRFHKADWAGHYLDTTEGIVHLCLPMRFETEKGGGSRTTNIGLGVDPRKEPGELLDPVRFPEDVVRGIERKLGPYGTAGQLQQRPTARDGAIFKTGHIQFVEMDEVPVKSLTRLVRGWDRAGSKNAGDYSSGVLMGMYEPKGEAARVYVLDVVRGQWSGAEVTNLMELYCDMDQTEYGSKVRTWFEREPGSSGKTLAESIVARMIGKRVMWDIPSGNKVVRAENYSIAMENWQVFVVKAKWNTEYVNELAIFDKGDHDDQVDASSIAFNKLTSGSFFDLPDPEAERRGEETGSVDSCKNNRCDRLARIDDPYCCDSCKIIHITGRDISEMGDAHHQECNFRHGNLSRSGAWEPATRI